MMEQIADKESYIAKTREVYSPGEAASHVGETQTHVSRPICRPRAGLSGEESGHYHCALTVESELVDQPFVASFGIFVGQKSFKKLLQELDLMEKEK